MEEACVLSFRDLSFDFTCLCHPSHHDASFALLCFGYIDRLSPATRSVTSLGSNVNTCEQYNACTHGMPTIAPQLGIAAQAVCSRCLPREALRAGLAV